MEEVSKNVNTGGNEENAKNLIKENGYNPEDFEIIYEYVPIEELE